METLLSTKSLSGNVRRARKIQFVLLAMLGATIWILYTNPSGPGDNYEPHHIANLFLPHFGIGSDLSTLPEAGNTLPTYYSLRETVLVVVAGSNPTSLYGSIYVIELFSRFFAFALLLGVVPDIARFRLPFSFVFSIVVNFPGIPILLLVLVLSTLIRLSITARTRGYWQWVVVILASFTTLALYWHTLSIVSFVVVSAYVFFRVMVIEPGWSRSRMRWTNFFTIFLLITAATWIFLRGDYVLKVSVLGILDSGRLLTLESIRQNLFNPGAFIPPEYRFRYDFFFPKSILDVIRYVSYVLAYFYVLYFLVSRAKSRQSRSVSVIYVLFGTLLVSDIITKILHYLVAGTVGADVWLTLLYPIIACHLFASIKKPTHAISRKDIKLLATAVFVASLILTSMFYAYVAHSQLPSRNTTLDRYSASFYWVVEKSRPRVVLSDADTAGYYQIIYTENEVYATCKLNNSDTTYAQYDSIAKGTFVLDNGTVFALNAYLYERHLTFGSLEFWNIFEPISRSRTDSNENLVCVFDDGFVQILL